MQKKILALAVAGLLSGTAFAQANVTIYGIVDLGYSSLSGSEVETLVPAAAAHKNRNAIDTAGQATSRIGFRGTEDLGGGLSAGFTLEFGVTPDNGAAVLSDRTQTLSLVSKTAGSLVMGRMINPARALVNAQDPFGGGSGVGHSQNIQWQTTWADNVIAYVSPTFSGFNLTAGYTNSLVGNEASVVRGAPDRDLKGFVIVPRYAVGPITAGFSYESFDRDGTAAANQDLELRRWNLAGSYDFGVVRVGLTYGELELNDDAATVGKLDGEQWMLSGRVPVTAKGTILASYNRAQYTYTAPGVRVKDKASQWAIGYNHAMSKRTNAYLTYAALSTNTAARGVFSLNRHFDGLAAAAPPVRGFTKGLNIGLRHNF